MSSADDPEGPATERVASTEEPDDAVASGACPIRGTDPPTKVSRYRTEAGIPCIDVKVGAVQQLFDNRDPAPFLARDLDPSLVEYLRDSAEDLLSKPEVRVVFWLETACAPREIETAFRAHFRFDLESLQRKQLRRRRAGEVTLVLAFGVIAALQAIAQLVPPTIPGPLGKSLQEGLVILSWVLMWRPVEILLYDWIPIRHDRKVVTKLLRAPIHVRVGRGPDSAPIHRRSAAVEAGA